MKGRWVGIGVTAVVGLLVAILAHVYITAYGTGDPQAERAAAYTPNSGAHEQSNTGHSCFGRTVEVRMVWKHANFGNGGLGDTPDHPQAAILTADATSGTVCFVSAMYGPAAARLPPGSIYLYGPQSAAADYLQEEDPIHADVLRHADAMGLLQARA